MDKLYVVSLEGISGTGKSKIMRLVMGYFREVHPKIRILGFSENLVSPSRQMLAEKVDKIRQSDAVEGKKFREDIEVIISTANDRAHITTTLISLARQSPGILFIDRWFPTGMAYQSLYGISPKEILNINLERGVYVPDLSFILTCAPGIASERVDKRTTKIDYGLSGKMSTIRDGDGLVNKEASLDKKRKIQERFLKLPSLLGKDKCIIVDTNRSYETILYDIISEIRSRAFGGSKASEHMAAIEALEDDGLPKEFPFDNFVISG